MPQSGHFAGMAVFTILWLGVAKDTNDNIKWSTIVVSGVLLKSDWLILMKTRNLSFPYTFGVFNTRSWYVEYIIKLMSRCPLIGSDHNIWISEDRVANCVFIQGEIILWIENNSGIRSNMVVMYAPRPTNTCMVDTLFIVYSYEGWYCIFCYSFKVILTTVLMSSTKPRVCHNCHNHLKCDPRNTKHT